MAPNVLAVAHRAMLTIALVTAVAACSAPSGPKTAFEAVDHPPPDRITDASAGSLMAEFRQIKEMEGIRFTSAYEPSPGRGENARFRVQAGETFLLVRDRGYGTTSIYTGFAEDLRQDSARRPVSLALITDSLLVIQSLDDDDGVQLAEVDPSLYEVVMVPVKDEMNKRRVLFYLGRIGSRIDLLYLEFVGDMSKPHIRRELNFDLAASHVVEVQGVRFEIIEADSSHVRFKRLPDSAAPDQPFEQVI